MWKRKSRGRRQEAGGRRQEAGGRRQEAGGRDDDRFSGITVKSFYLPEVKIITGKPKPSRNNPASCLLPPASRA
jgi:hypothetical protein